jgi:hypothetical protein
VCDLADRPLPASREERLQLVDDRDADDLTRFEP